MARDGFRYSQVRFQQRMLGRDGGDGGGGGGGDGARSTASDKLLPQGGGSPKKQEKRERNDKAEKAHKAEKKERKHEEVREAGGVSGAISTASASSGSPVTEPRDWQPTRSVLQQGARETGVKVGDHQPGQGLRGLR